MSSPRGSKRSRDTSETEHNKRPRFNPTANSISNGHHRHQQSGPQLPRVAADEYLLSAPSDQIASTSDEVDEIERLEREAEQLARRLEVARQRKRERAQRSQSRAISQTPRGSHPETRTARHRPSSSRPTGPQGIIAAPIPHSSQPGQAASPQGYLLNKQNRPCFQPLTNLAHSPHPSAPAPPRPQASSIVSNTTATPLLEPQNPDGFYTTVPSTGKRPADEYRNDFDEEIDRLEEERASQRRTLYNGRPEVASQPSQLVQGPSHDRGHDPRLGSDGFDLCSLYPATAPRNHASGANETNSNPTSFIAADFDPSFFDPAGSTIDSNTPNLPDWANVLPPDPNKAIGIYPTQELWNEADAPLPDFATAIPGTISQHDAIDESLVVEAVQEFGSQIPADMPLQPHLPPGFSPYAAAEHLGKHRRDVGFSGDDVNVVQDESSPAADEPATKRQKRVKKIEAKGEKLGKDNRKMNEVRQREDGSLECKIKGVWTPAAYHNDRRHTLLQRADLAGSWKHPMEHGAHDDDRMAYHPLYADINMEERRARPHILYEWWKPEKKPERQDPGYMRDEADGRVLMDVGGHPIKAWPELPVCISGQTSPIWFELWRRQNQGISLPDIVARCPKQTQKRAGTQVQELTIQAYGNRMRRARVQMCTKAWDPREGTEGIQSRLLELMPNRVKANLETDGSTVAWRDLTTPEIDAVFHINKGKGNATKRAGKKALPEAVKTARDAKKQAEVDGILRTMRQEKEEEDRRYAASRDETVQELTHPDAKGPSQTNHDRSPEAAAEGSDLGAGVEQVLNREYEKPEEISFSEPLGDISFEETNVRTDLEGSTLMDLPLEEGDTTLIQDGDDQQLTGDMEFLEKLMENDGNPTVTVEQIWDIDNFDFAFDEPADYRLRIPETEDQISTISAAIEKTRDECRRLTNLEPPPIQFPTTYFLHYHELQNWLYNVYIQTKPGACVPTLFERPEWTGSWDAWKAQDAEFPNVPANVPDQEGIPNAPDVTGKKITGNTDVETPANGSIELDIQGSELGANNAGESGVLEQGDDDRDSLDDLFEDQDLGYLAA